LVVWEPILPTDWRPPSASALARIADARVRQFWDPGHAVASALGGFAVQKPDQPHPQCCVQRGFNWDEAILYAPHSQWKDTPVAVFWNGPIVRVASGLETAFKGQLGPAKPDIVMQ
jgi:hypothetical protein